MTRWSFSDCQNSIYLFPPEFELSMIDKWQNMAYRLCISLGFQCYTGRALRSCCLQESVIDDRGGELMLEIFQRLYNSWNFFSECVCMAGFLV